MIFSTKYSYLVLRIALAIVFFWFGVRQFFLPDATQAIYITGILEVLIGLSLLTGVLIKFFSVLGVILLIYMAIPITMSDQIIKDIGLLGALFAILLWPKHGSR